MFAMSGQLLLFSKPMTKDAVVARLAESFVQQAKQKQPLRLHDAVVTFFRQTGGVGKRKAFLPPKTANLRSLRSSGRSKVQGPRSKPATAPVLNSCRLSYLLLV